MHTKLEDSINNYGNETTSSVTNAWDFTQTTFHCCGVYSYEDWENATNWTNLHLTTDSTFEYPASCCHSDLPVNWSRNAICEKDIIIQQKHGNGCYTIMYETLVGNTAASISVCAMTLMFLEVLVLSTTYFLSKHIVNNDTINIG